MQTVLASAYRLECATHLGALGEELADALEQQQRGRGGRRKDRMSRSPARDARCLTMAAIFSCMTEEPFWPPESCT